MNDPLSDWMAGLGHGLVNGIDYMLAHYGLWSVLAIVAVASIPIRWVVAQLSSSHGDPRLRRV